MTEILTAAQMRSIEQAAIESGEVTGLELMERAGRGVVEAVFEEWPSYRLSPRRAIVLCGPGNNGGDGYVVARLLRDLHWDVTVFSLGDPEKLPPDAKTNYRRWLALGDVQPLSERAFRAAGAGYADLYVDALFGTGMSRPVSGEAWSVLTHLAGRNGDDYAPYIVAIDAPSGLCLDSGRLLGTANGSYAHGHNRFAALTVTFDSPKQGQFLADGPGLCGKLAVKDIGLRKWRETGAGRAMRLPQTVLVTDRSVVPDRRHALSPLRVPVKSERNIHAGHTHKFSFGHGVIVSGGAGRTGAARLAARSALRVGAGLVSLAVPPDAAAEVAAQITAPMMRAVPDAGAMAEMLTDARLNAICIGPGLGLGPNHAALVETVLKTGRPTVLDADALSLVARDDQLRNLLHQNCVLTPHNGEFKRLFPEIEARLSTPSAQSFSKVDAVRAAAAEAGCTVLLKGRDTVIATPQGQCAIHAAVYERAAPWLATAGSGDVLAGLIAGLLAQGYAAFEAAATGAWLHVECARQFGPGLIAEDLPEQLPGVLRRVISGEAGRV
ncbi:NAD(P)H-hydrate dehydratase [Thalassobius vesicularis]|uniref:Bifunctional NAD(P)H-hydrate repair enzyme n=1 Tax=Thalassobius vesicularis TaxID=1294297 RepID=A0A4S3M8P2_9RHOB|nr:NAD(P)H-hydrate dehydratase [Thalassobius vesicularis]THD72695.1 NAD(P)H-hydrate dehydratase [Thalassobius vesicularis]